MRQSENALVRFSGLTEILHPKITNYKNSNTIMLFMEAQTVLKEKDIESEQNHFTSWDFREAETKEYTHSFHTYPAMMIPQIARRLIYLYGKNAKTLLDPFMGSGTSLVEASMTPHIKEAFGTDLNPLAVLISLAKTTPLSPKKLIECLKIILQQNNPAKPPTFDNINFWFKPEVIIKLAQLKQAIMQVNDSDMRNFFMVAFSEAVRNVSNTRKREFKLYRMSKQDLEEHNPDVLNEFRKISLRNIQGMQEYIARRAETVTIPKLCNSQNGLGIAPATAELIVTSPPYGDSRTTVAYGQFSRLALQWLGYEEAAALDKQLLGGSPSKSLLVEIGSETLKTTIAKIAESDEKRAREVLSFYNDFDKCVERIDEVLASNAYLCFVVGNRTVKGVTIPTDKIMTELFLSRNNYEYITTHCRTIPFKRMPRLNSPSNIAGETLPTMSNEYIFVLRKN